MPFDWREFLIVAHGMRNERGEGAQRTCLGRAYYYVYNLGLAKARAANFTGQKPGLHTKLWDWCQKQPDPVVKQLGIAGLRMLRLRIEADYNDSAIPNLAVEVQTQISRAQLFESLVAKSDGQAPPPSLAP